MENWKNIGIIAFTLGITILPMTGKIWSFEDKKIYLRGWIFIAFAISSLILGVFQIRQDSQNQTARDSNQITTLKNTESILNNLDSSMSNIEYRLIRIDSLNNKLDTLEFKTVEVLKKRDDILIDLDNLNNKLEKLYDKENRKLKENIPVVEILDGVNWIKDKGKYKITVVFSNTGNRVASQLYYDIWFFNTTSNDKIIHHKLLSNHVTNGKDLSPTKRSGYNSLLTFPNIPLISPFDSIPTGYLWIKYNYKDLILDTTIYKEEGYMWRGVNLDDLKWRSLPIHLEKNIKNFGRIKGLKL